MMTKYWVWEVFWFVNIVIFCLLFLACSSFRPLPPCGLWRGGGHQWRRAPGDPSVLFLLTSLQQGKGMYSLTLWQLQILDVSRLLENKPIGKPKTLAIKQRGNLTPSPLTPGVQQHGASVFARREADSSSNETQPEWGGGREAGQPQWPQVQRPQLAGGISRDVSGKRRHTVKLYSSICTHVSRTFVCLMQVYL